MYGPVCSSTLGPASLPLLFSSPAPPFTPLSEPPATPFPLKSFSLVTAFDRSIDGRLVGTLTGGGSTLKPFGGAASATFGSLGSSTTTGVGAFGFGSTFLTFGGSGFFTSTGGGGSFFMATKLSFSA